MHRFVTLLVLVIVLALPTMMVAGCLSAGNKSGPPPQQSLSGATQIATFDQIPKNSQKHTMEQQNIIDRIKVTTDPTKILWIHLISLDGKIIRRMPVRNKVTSSGKRLEPQHAAVESGSLGSYPVVMNTPNGGTIRTDELVQPDGTFGESDSYIFWFDPMGRYHQWGTAGGLGYLLTDYPIDLQNPIDEITGLYNVQLQAQAWQQQEEAKLKGGH